MTNDSAPVRRILDVFVIARSLSYLADALKTFIIPVLVFERTGSATMSGIALAVEYVPKIVLLPFIGTLSQRFRLRPQFLLGDAARAGLCIALVFTVPIHMIMIVSALIAVFSSYTYLLNESLVAVAFVGGERTVVQARLQAADQLARVTGPALGAVLYVHFDIHVILAVAASLFTLCGLGLFGLPKVADRAAAIGQNTWGGIGRGIRILRASPMLIHLTFLVFATNFAGGVVLAIAPAMITENFNLPLHYFGIVASVTSAASAGVMIFIGRGTPSGATAVFGRRALAAVVLSLVMITAAPNFIVFMGGYTLFTIGSICFATYMRVERLRFIPSDSVGETIGLTTALFWFSVPLSGGVVAALASPAGLRVTMLVAALATILCILYLQRGLGKANMAISSS